jgi:hypothetical protein
MRVSIYWLCQATEKHRGTVKKRVSALDADKHGRYDSAAALEAIYCGAGSGDNGEFISTPEAVRQFNHREERADRASKSDCERRAHTDRRCETRQSGKCSPPFAASLKPT